MKIWIEFDAGIIEDGYLDAFEIDIKDVIKNYFAEVRNVIINGEIYKTL
jgi:hypothetical protein